MNVVLAKTDSGRALGEAFAIARPRLPGTGKMADKRRQAFEAYERVGLPHRRIEDWKYTDLRVLMREVLPLAAAPDAAALARAAAALKLHAIDGVRNQASASARCARCWKPVTPRCMRSCLRLNYPTPWWRSTAP
jgi:Fe-S cluster assembly protein SufD